MAFATIESMSKEQIGSTWRNKYFRLRLQGEVCPRCEQPKMPERRYCSKCATQFSHQLVPFVFSTEGERA